jgi:hypothetical protein
MLKILIFEDQDLDLDTNRLHIQIKILGEI